MPFSQEQRARLEAPLDKALIHTRRKQGVELKYVEGHAVIDAANSVFGYHAWSYRVTKLELLDGVWVATVLLTVTTPEGENAAREDVGVGIPATPRGEAPSPDATETAVKAAVTDALKRALRTFGNAFGNSLYSKEDEAAGGETRQQQGDRRESARQPDVDNGETRACPSCDEPMVLRSGTTRDGRPYSAWFCSVKCGQKPIWLADRNGAS